MSIATLLVLTAVVSSVVLVTQATARLWPLVALVASGLEALLAFGVVRFSVAGLNVGFVLAVALLVGAGASWMTAGSKAAVTAATAAAMVGALQLSSAIL